MITKDTKLGMPEGSSRHFFLRAGLLTLNELNQETLGGTSDEAAGLDLDTDVGSPTPKHHVPSGKLLPLCWLLPHANNATHLQCLLWVWSPDSSWDTESLHMAASTVLVLILPPFLGKSFYLSSASSDTAALSSAV